MLVLVGGCWWLGACGGDGVCVLVVVAGADGCVVVVGCWWWCWCLGAGAAVAGGWVLML